MKTAALLFVAFVLSVSASAQDLKQIEKSKHYRIEYDKFKDRTTIRTGNYSALRLNGKRYTGTGVNSRLTFDGKTPGTNNVYRLAFMWNGDLDNVTEAILLVDGEKITLTNGDYDPEAFMSGGFRLSEVAFELTAAEFRKIGSAAKVEFQVGFIEAALDENALRTMRELSAL